MPTFVIIAGQLHALAGVCGTKGGLESWTGDQVVLGSNPAAATSLRNFGNSVYPTLPVFRRRH